jgi:hypothetical protein
MWRLALLVFAALCIGYFLLYFLIPAPTRSTVGCWSGWPDDITVDPQR